MPFFARAAALLAAILAPAFQPAFAQPLKVGDLIIDSPWARATPGGAKVGAGYLTITNKGAAADKLVGGTGPLGSRLEIHEMTMTDGVMKMRGLSGGLALAPGQTVKLAPGGLHLMFMGLTAPLKAGETAEITLTFEKAGNTSLQLPISPIGAPGPAMAAPAPTHDHGAMHHHHHAPAKP